MDPDKKIKATKLGPMAADKVGTNSTPLQRKLRLVHRILVFGTAVWYVVISLMATNAALLVLKQNVRYDSDLYSLASPFIAGYAGTRTIQNSPLVVDILGGSTNSNDSGTLYLESESSSSFTQCEAVVEGNGANIYKDEYLRWMFAILQDKTAYNISILEKVELVLPVVDCGSQVISAGDEGIARVNYLVRSRETPERMFLLPTSFSVQDYSIAEQYERGSALLVTFSVIEDMADPSPISNHHAIALDYPYEYRPDFEVCTFYEYTDKGFWSLETIPRDPFMRPPKPLLTARQLGFYLNKESSQANQINFHWNVSDDPYSALTYWYWHGDAVIRDNWAWVHIIHLTFAIDVLFQLSLLLFLVYRSIMQKHVWIGDAFASISSALLYRGIYVIITNHVNGYWTLVEFCLALADTVGGNTTVKFHPEMAHADMLTIYLNIVSVFSYLFRERIDPLVAVVCFEVGFYGREKAATVFPALQQMLVDYSNTESKYGRMQVNDFLANLSPMRLSTIHPISQGVMPLIAVTFVAIFSTLIVVVLYVVARKLIQCYSLRSQVGSLDDDSGRQSSSLFRSDSTHELMQFETATGSVLKNRFGILSTYKNYTFKDGCRFVSGDAIYCNGFVVANGKFVIATEDLLPLIVMKITRTRFTNIYVYTVKEDTGVNQTARLVYPSTISWRDLAKVSVSPLS